MRRSTIAAVAAEAGVGVGTVSRVLNGSPSVSEDTRRRVLEAIALLDYQPSAVARALSTGRTHAVGVVAPFFTQPSVVERLRGMSRTLSRSRHQLILIDVERPEQRRDVFRSASVRGRYDALLTVSLAPSETEAQWRKIWRLWRCQDILTHGSDSERAALAEHLSLSSLAPTPV